MLSEIISGRAVDVGRRKLLFVVIDSLALTMLTVESNDVVCRLEFECLSVGRDGCVDDGSLSTFRKRSGISTGFDVESDGGSVVIVIVCFCSSSFRLDLDDRSDGVISNL